MRVLYFTQAWTAHDQRFLSALAHTSHQVHYLRLEDGGNRPADLPSGIYFQSWAGVTAGANLQDGLECLPQLAQLIDSLQPDLIHAGPIQRVARLVARVGFHPLVSMSWGSDLLLEAGQDREWQLATQEALKGTDVLVGDCQAVRNHAAELGFPMERIILFPWGVDLAHFKPEPGDLLRRKYDWENVFILLSARSWELLYGVEIIAKAFVQAARQRPQLRMIMLGNGSQAGVLREILTRGGVIEKVAFSGQVPLSDLPDYYRAANLYVSASHSDGSSVSLMEALACGIPALVSDIPGNQEWIEPGQTGWLFPDGDVDALAARIIEVVDHPERLASMCRAARTLAESRADWSQNFPRLLDAYALAVK